VKKITAVIAAVLLSASLTRANLIDLTPGGFDLTQPFPIAVQQFFARYGEGMQNLAAASVVNGQVQWSPFTPFGDDHFDLALNPGGTSANVGWDLTGTGFHELFVFVESLALIGNLYAVPGMEQFTGDGFAEINGTIPLLAVTFTGSNRTPDTGSTLALMGIATVAVFFLHRRVRA